MGREVAILNDKELSSLSQLEAHKEMVRMIHIDAEDLTIYDKLVLWLLDEAHESRTTRIQKLGLIVNSLREGRAPSSHGPHFYGGFSDEIDESLIHLRENGLVKESGAETYSLSTYGKEVVACLAKSMDPESKKIHEASGVITPALRGMSDRDVTALTYALFPELTTESVIKAQIQKRTDSGQIKGIRIYRFKKSELKDFLKSIS
jgi:uncharacterized protein YwgA